MDKLVYYSFAAVLGGMAYSHIAYLLQYGSIFNAQRTWLARAREPSLKRKILEGIMCQVCCITQLTLWLWTLPILWFGYDHGVALKYLVVGTPIVWFSEAALGLASYDLFRLVGRGSEALIQRLRKESR